MGIVGDFIVILSPNVGDVSVILSVCLVMYGDEYVSLVVAGISNGRATTFLGTTTFL